MLFGGFAHDYVGQPRGEGRGDDEGNGTELHAGEPLHSPRHLLRQRVGDLARFLPRGVEPGFYASVDLGQELHGLAQSPDQLFFWNVVERVGELLELVDFLLESTQILPLLLPILHWLRTIHYPDPAFGPGRPKLVPVMTALPTLTSSLCLWPLPGRLSSLRRRRPFRHAPRRSPSRGPCLCA